MMPTETNTLVKTIMNETYLTADLASSAYSGFRTAIENPAANGSAS
jgi:hypothetical protein